jgi:MoxR-like ATPase
MTSDHSPVEHTDMLRPHAEDQFVHELHALANNDDRPRPAGWRLSPWRVVDYLVGATLPDGTVITAKYLGSRRPIELSVAALATDRALLLLGLPGTAKTWVSEHLAAAISGDSTKLVQGTAGTDESALRYGWDYAQLLAKGPSRSAIVPSPVMRAMETGSLVRIEELTRLPSEVQDALITVLSEKVLPVPELTSEVAARPGFNLIATANDRDRGVNDLSSALRRRFATVVLPLPASVEAEIDIVATRAAQLADQLGLAALQPSEPQLRQVVTVLRELRDGRTVDGQTQLKRPSSSLSAADAIAIVVNGLSLSTHFGDGRLRPADVLGALTATVVRDPVSDRQAWLEYLDAVVRHRPDWAEFHDAALAENP